MLRVIVDFLEKSQVKIELIWDEEVPNVVRYEFQAGWTWAEFHDTALREHEWGEQLNGVRYDIIGNVANAGLPSGPGFSNVLRLFDQGPQNRKTITIVGSMLVRTMVSTANKAFPRTRGRFYPAQTLEEARRWILRLRSENPA
jgi:hypothetical protein